MKKEFKTLSEKETYMKGNRGYYSKDVKEAVKRLKEDFEICRDKTDIWADEERWNNFEGMFIKKIIEIFGKELI